MAGHKKSNREPVFFHVYVKLWRDTHTHSGQGPLPQDSGIKLKLLECFLNTSPFIRGWGEVINLDQSLFCGHGTLQTLPIPQKADCGWRPDQKATAEMAMSHPSISFCQQGPSYPQILESLLLGFIWPERGSWHPHTTSQAREV